MGYKNEDFINNNQNFPNYFNNLGNNNFLNTNYNNNNNVITTRKNSAFSAIK